MKVYINFNTGSGESNITNYIKSSSFQRKQNLHNDLRLTVNTLSLEIKNNNALILQIMNNSDTDIRVTEDDGSAYFKGKVRNNFGTKVSSTLENLKIEVVDYTYKLNSKIPTTCLWQDYKICDTSNPSASILHQLFILAGFSLSDLSLIDIDIIIPYLYLEADTVIKNIISDLTFQYGQVVNCESDGSFKNYSIVYASTFATNYLNNTNLIKELEIRQIEEKFESVKIQWASIDVALHKVVLSDISNGDNLNKCNIDLLPKQYYMDSDGSDIYSDYQYEDKEIIYVEGATLNIDKESNVVVNKFESLPKGVKLNIQNTSTIENGAITKLDVVGTVYYKGALNKEIVSNISDTEKIEEVDGTYIFTKENAQNLASYHAHYYKHSDTTYTATSKNVLELGELVNLHETTQMTLDITAFVSQIIDKGDGYYIYTLIPVTNYETSTISRQIFSNLPAPTRNITTLDLPEMIPDFNDINTGAIFSDTEQSLTTIPTIPTLNLIPLFKGVQIVMDMQHNLTNFTCFEMQVSDDSTNWYSLSTSEDDWKGIADEVTTSILYKYIHYPIPFDSADCPVGKTLYYRVRRLTSTGLASGWSTVGNTTTLTIQNGDLPANVINANNIQTGVLEALFANIETLAAGYKGDGTYSTPSDGDYSLMIDEARMYLQENIDGWSDVNKLSFGIAVGNRILAMLESRGVIHPNADASDLIGDTIPSIYLRNVSFESDYNDQHGTAPTTTSNVLRDTSEKKYGSYSLRYNATSGAGVLIYDNVLSLSTRSGFAFWLKAANFGTATNGGNILVDSTYTISSYVSMRAYIKMDNISPRIITAAVTERRTQTEWSTYNITGPNLDDLIGDWHHLGLVIDPIDNKVSLVVDNVKYSQDITPLSIAGAPTTNTATFYAVPASYANTFTTWFDDMLFGYDVGFNPDFLIKHYEAGIPWQTDYSYADLVIRPAPGGKVLIDGDLSINGSDFNAVVCKSGQIGTAQIDPSSPTVLRFNEFWADEGEITYDSTTGRFIIPEDGIYRITLNPFFKTGVSAGRVMIGVNTDSPTVSTHKGHTYRSSTNYETGSIDSVIPLNKDDYIVFYLSSGALYNQSGDRFNQFTITKITGLKGEAGEKGDKGDKGDSGIDGIDGTNGIDGIDGAPYYQ